MRKAFKKLWNDKRGNVLVIAGAALPMLMGAAGIATDTIQWALWKRELQRAADSAAIAGVYDRNTTGNTAGTEAAVLHDLDTNHHTGLDWVNDPQVTFPADDEDMENQVNVVLTVRKSLPFSSMFMNSAPIIRASARAASVPGGDIFCVISLDRRSTIVGIEISGSTDLDLGECSLIANSTHPNKAASNGSNSSSGGQGSTVKAKSLAAAGGVQNSTSWDVDSYDPYATPADDPYESLDPPTSCDKTLSVAKKDFPINRVGKDTGQTVCINGGLTVQGAMTLDSGTYVINGGDLTMNSAGSSLSCNGCTIVMSNLANRAQTGNIKLTGGTLNLVAPSEGEYANIALYQDELAADDGKKGQNHINGNSNGGVTGAIYTPSRSILYNGGGNLVAVCMQIIGGRVEFSGSSKIRVASECPGAPDTSGGRRVRLVA